MRSPLVALSAAAILTISAATHAQHVEAQVVNLPNGMKFILVPRHDQPNTISAGWVAKVGSVNERPGITGISHFFEHMMFKGTNTIGTANPDRDAKYREEQRVLRNAMNQITWSTQYQRFFAGEINDPWSQANDTDELKQLRTSLKDSMDAQQGRSMSDEITAAKKEVAAIDTAAGRESASLIETQIAQMESDQKAMASIVKDEFDQIYTKGGASQMNAFTSEDVTFYIISIPSNKFELWSWMESNRLSDSVFREFYSERDVVHEERRLRTESTPTGVFDEQFNAMFWVSCGYSWPVIGWTSDLNSYSMEEALKYWNIYYRANNLTGVVVGDFDPKEIVPMIERYFGRLQAGTIAPPPVVTLESKQMAEMRMNAEADCQPQVEVRYHAVAFGHADSYPLDVLAEVLNGRTGRLYKGLEEGREIASSTRAQNDAKKYAGAFSFAAETKGDATPGQLEAAWYEELSRLQTELVPDREMQKVKNGLAADSYRRLQNNFFLMIQLGYAEALTGWEEINDGPAKLLAVTPEDIQRVAKKYFSETNRAVATYTRKQAAGGAGGAAADPELAALSGPMQARARQGAAQIAQMSDANELEQALAMMDAQAAQVPEQAKPLIAYMKRKMLERLEVLRAGSSGSAPPVSNPSSTKP